MRIVMLAAALALVSLTGCASIVNGQNQSLSVETRSGGTAVSGANCTLTNNKGVWYVTTPGSTTVNRSYEDLAVRCEKASMEPGLASIKSTTKGMAFGNILFGGIIGAGVDISTGAAYDYPSLITVAMGSTAALNATSAGATNSAVPQPSVASAMPAASSGQSPPVVQPAPVAPPPAVAVQTSSPPVSPLLRGVGVDSYSAERLARQSACTADPAATLVANGPGYESFSIKCTNGDVLMVRCESGSCRALK